MFSYSCKKCNVQFTTRKKDQMYCSKSCANSINTSKRKIEDTSIFFNGLNEVNTYILGLIYSDGCLSYDKHTQRMRITISMNEKKLMQSINEIMTPYKKLYSYKHPNGNNITYSVISTNREDINFFKSLGLTERKSLKLLFPHIDSNLKSHFIRGYFDGDGSIYKNTTTTYYNEKITKYYYTNVSFATGSKQFAVELKDILEDQDISCRMVSDSRVNHNCWYVKIYSELYVKKFYEYIYKDALLFLERKHLRFIEMI